MQDAVLRIGDIDFEPRDKRMLLVGNRFAWEKRPGFLRRRHERRQTVLQFDRVLAVSSTGIDRNDSVGVLSLLAVTFTPTDAPAGHVELHFSGGPAIRLQVECIEARMTDLGGAWETRLKPQHRI